MKDFRIYFNEKPSELQVCAKKIKIIDINKATQVLHQADSKDQLLDNLEKTFTESRKTLFGGGKEIDSFSGLQKLYNQGNQPC